MRRLIFAFATRISSALVGFCLGAIDFLELPAIGIIGNAGVGIIDARSIGCVLIGPAVGLLLGIVDNPFLPKLFKRPRTWPAHHSHARYGRGTTCAPNTGTVCVISQSVIVSRVKQRPRRGLEAFGEAAQADASG
jgi:hypothetical protein